MNKKIKLYGNLGSAIYINLDEITKNADATILKSPNQIDFHVFAQYGGSSSCCASMGSGSCNSEFLSLLDCC